MKHRARRRAAASDNALPAKVEAPPPAVEAFSFGDPSPVLEGRDMLADVECYRNGDWYEPPLSMVGLAKSLNASVHHASAIWCKVNILASTFQPSAVLSRGDFTRLALDFLLFGNCYAERRESMTGKLLSLKPALAKYTRAAWSQGGISSSMAGGIRTNLSGTVSGTCRHRISTRKCMACRNT